MTFDCIETKISEAKVTLALNNNILMYAVVWDDIERLLESLDIDKP